ncbi:DEAD-box ATP-dependent RNA helicase 28 [Phytophthora nicotianae]|uniref:DEAD-box ATP-dependent RNA helicase 28 n=1 Tax=Phytophthora nicotianae TaxID=4792 RepID=A0A0W8DQC6_PHYNI|nr:DEAD-box ATP-dependent RNA helicase 28 [Phytophthora nicotianae]
MATISGDASADLSAESPKHGEERYTRDREQEALVKNEFNISSSDEDEEDRSQTSVGDDGTDEDASKTGKRVEIRLNPKARKVGRPQKQKKKTAAGEKKDRRWYETTEAARAQAGEVSLLALVDSLDREQPGLKETQGRLSGVIVKHGEAEKKKPKLKLMKNPVLTMDPIYLLPTKLLDACVKLLPTEDTVIRWTTHNQAKPHAQTLQKAM